MNRDPALLPFIKAYLEGKEIEVFSTIINKWIPCNNPVFDSKASRYRIKETKPLPLEELEKLVGKTVKQYNGGVYLVTAAYTHINWGEGTPAVALGGVQGAVTNLELQKSYCHMDNTPLELN